MEKKIVVLPLDERPCNRYFPERLFAGTQIRVVFPEKLGEKKKPADRDELAAFLERECRDANGLILSMDMLVYGGLVPSRIHHESKEELLQRMEFIRELRRQNPRLLIYAFQVIMRCPDYSSSDEEPDYYEQYGKQIHDAGVAIHKSRLGLGDKTLLPRLMEQIDAACLDDYVSRREVNRFLNVETLQYLRDGWLDALVIPQDDSAAYGYAAMDQQAIRRKIQEYDMVDRVLVYPGADEVELTLLSRMVNVMNGRRPRVYIKYAADGARSVIPLYEGSPLGETLKYHILSAGCQQADIYEQADLILVVTAPAERMAESVSQFPEPPENYAKRNLPELIDFVEARIQEGRIVTIADNAYANGGDLMFIHLLDKNGMLMRVGGYAGWNTSANTIGTALSEAVVFLYYGRNQHFDSFLAERYIEDGGYCAKVRQEVTDQLTDGLNYFDIRETDGEVCRQVRGKLEAFVQEMLPSVADDITITGVHMPWKRMFEVDLTADYKKRELE